MRANRGNFAMKMSFLFATLCALAVWQTEAQTYDTNNVLGLHLYRQPLKMLPEQKALSLHQ
jgi:hypothetical protein